MSDRLKPQNELRLVGENKNVFESKSKCRRRKKQTKEASDSALGC